jgi:putative ATP-binding cassette transporter
MIVLIDNSSSGQQLYGSFPCVFQLPLGGNCLASRGCIQMTLLKFILRYSQKLLAFAVAAGIVSGMCTTGLLAIINAAVTHSHLAARTAVYLFITCAVVVPLSRALSEMLLVHVGQRTLLSVRTELSRQVLEVPLQDLETIGTHRILAVLTEDIPTITNLIGVVPLFCINIAVIVACLVYMVWLSPSLTGAALGFIVVGILTYQLSVFKATGHFRLARAEHDSLQKHFHALVTGAKELKLHRARRAAFFNDVLRATADRMRRRNIAGMTLYVIASSWGQLLVFITLGMVIFLASSLIHADGATLTGFALVLLYLMGPLQMIMNTMPQFGRANVAIGNVSSLGFSLSQATLPSAAVHHGLCPPENWQHLVLNGVGYKYHDEEERAFVLGPLDLTFSQGEIVFLTGGNGSGKTTLAKLLVGLYTPESGHIHLSGTCITESNRDDYRQFFSAIFSDFHLFDELLGLSSAALDAQAQRYIHEFRLSETVQVKDGVFSSLNLSQGQRKRLALVTAYLEGRPIYLFDEWAADQDVVFKEIFYTNVLPELKAQGRTVFVISHDDQYYWAADRLVKLESGQVVSDYRPSRQKHHEVLIR